MPSRSQQRLFFTKLYFHQNCLVLFNYFLLLLTALSLSEKLLKNPAKRRPALNLQLFIDLVLGLGLGLGLGLCLAWIVGFS